MSCKVLVALWAFVIVATAMSVKKPSGGAVLRKDLKVRQSWRGGEAQSGLQTLGSLSGRFWKQSMSVASGITGRHKVPSISAAAVMSNDYPGMMGTERQRIVADATGKKIRGKMGAKLNDSKKDPFSQTDHSDKLDRNEMKESTSAPINRTSPDSESPSQRCCMPNQFEAILASHIGTVRGRNLPRSGLSLTLLSYDYTNKKLHLMYPDMHGEMYRILIDFSKKPATSYTVMADGSCQCAPMFGNMVPWCTPASAELTNGLSLTGSGDNVNMFVSPDSPISMTLTRKSDCIFLMTSRTAGNPGKRYASMTITTYMNVTIGISNPDIMKIPHACNCTSKA